MRHAVGTQCVDFWQTELQGMKTEHVCNGTIKLRTFPVQQVAAVRRLEEIMQTYNLDAHEPESASRSG